MYFVAMKTNKKIDSTTIESGVTAPAGFKASGVAAGIKKSQGLDTGLLYSEAACSSAGTFTRNAVRAACVDFNSCRLPSQTIHAIFCNSGNANACTGQRGKTDAETTAKLVADELGCSPDAVLIASTGVIGEYLPMDKIEAAVPECAENATPKGGNAFARAIMTTDTVSKEYAVRVNLEGGKIVVGGCAKGSGMIHPNMATMLAFLTTDAAVDSKLLDVILRQVVDQTFNNLTVDGDTSTNDMVLALSNGLSAVSVQSDSDISRFTSAIYEVCNALCAKIAEDGEGATKRIEVNVTGGSDYESCRIAAKAVANSNLVKTAIFGNDPNWGRILCAVGYSGAQFSREKISVSLCGMPVCAALRPVKFPRNEMAQALAGKVIAIDVDLGMGEKTCAVAHTCDLTYDYIRINAEYHT